MSHRPWNRNDPFGKKAAAMRGCPVACAELSDMYSTSDLMGMMDHGMHSQACAYDTPDPDPTPLFFKRKSKPPSRADLDLKRRILKLRNKLRVSQANGGKK